VRGIIAWFAANPVAAHLLTAMVLIGGLATLLMGRHRVEVFPEFALDVISVRVLYPGASPEEVEASVLLRIEERIHDLVGIKRIHATAKEGLGLVAVQVQTGHDPRRLLDEIKARVDGIDSFPDGAQRPLVEEAVARQQVLDIAVHGDADERTLKAIGMRIRDEVAALPGLSLTELAHARDDEIAIELSEAALRRHQLTFDQVAAAVRAGSLDLPGGNLRTAGGEVLLRTRSQAYSGRDFAALPLLTRADGTRVLLGEIARIDDGFADGDRSARFDGRPAVVVSVFRVGQQNALAVAQAARDHVERARATLPAGIALTVWNDTSLILTDRIDLLVSNAVQGFLLVFLVLALFLRFRLAFWASMGIPVSFCGCLLLMPVLDVSINMISLFAFILVLGIVVDDAIVIGENTHARRLRGEGAVESATKGVLEVAAPVAAAVLTAVIAFAPMLMLEGFMGKIFRVIPLICITTLFASLIETLLCLPAHLAHGGGRTWRWFELAGLAGWWGRIQDAMNAGLEWFATRVYQPLLDGCLRRPLPTLAGFAAVLAITVTVVVGGLIKFDFFPQVEGDIVVVDVALPAGAAATQTAAAVRQIEAAAIALRDRLNAGRPADRRVVRHLLTTIGSQPYRIAANRGDATGFSDPHLGEVILQLAPTPERDLTTAAVEQALRAAVGEVAGAEEVTYSTAIAHIGAAVDVQLSGPDLAELAVVAGRLKAELAAIPGVHGITDSNGTGKRELVVTALPGAGALGLRQADIARQVRQAFFGEEAQRVQRGREEVKVMVRYPANDRRTLGGLDALHLRTPAGDVVPLAAVARLAPGAGYTAIQRSDRRRTIDITADLDKAVANGGEVNRVITAGILPRLLAEHPGVAFSLEGEQREQGDAFKDLAFGALIALALIYGVLAVVFRSFAQPFLLLIALPFGLVGTVVGHLLFGFDLSVMTLMGLVALSGVVVNDSIVLVEFINQARAGGMAMEEAVRTAGAKRFRAIMLTATTTFIGLVPIIIAGRLSVQAQFLVPMAITLGFGSMCSVLTSLVLVPTCYRLLEAAKARLRGGGGAAAAPPSQV